MNGRSPCIFACGADMKNRPSFFRNSTFYFGPANPDMQNADAYRSCVDFLGEAEKAFHFSPDIVAFDAHPGYFSRRISTVFDASCKRLPVQHHHAHIASVLFGRRADTPVIGISFDGTGWGSDGALWGGEFLLVSGAGFNRAAHLAYMKMPGFDAAVRSPWRMAFSLAYDALGDEVFEKDLSFLGLRPRREYTVLKAMLDENINTCLTSSCGRLFDAVSSLLGITHTATYEAEAAINLEKKAASIQDAQSYPFEIKKEGGASVVSCKKMIREIIKEMERAVSVERIAARFHNTVAEVILAVAQALRCDFGINTVVMSGGVFQNKVLYALALQRLKKDGFEVFENRGVPVNDAGICVGQTYVALKSN